MAASATPTLDDDVISRVSANTTTVLTSADLAAGLTAGNTYRGIVALDQLEVGGGAQVVIAGDLIVYNGDAAMAAQLAVEDRASLTVSHQLEVDGVAQTDITGTVSANPSSARTAPDGAPHFRVDPVPSDRMTTALNNCSHFVRVGSATATIGVSARRPGGSSPRARRSRC